MSAALSFDPRALVAPPLLTPQEWALCWDTDWARAKPSHATLDHVMVAKVNGAVETACRAAALSLADRQDVRAQVWIELLEKPPGHTVDYVALARTIARRRAVDCGRRNARDQGRRPRAGDALRPPKVTARPKATGGDTGVERANRQHDLMIGVIDRRAELGVYDLPRDQSAALPMRVQATAWYEWRERFGTDPPATMARNLMATRVQPLYTRWSIDAADPGEKATRRADEPRRRADARRGELARLVRWYDDLAPTLGAPLTDEELAWLALRAGWWPSAVSTEGVDVDRVLHLAANAVAAVRTHERTDFSSDSDDSGPSHDSPSVNAATVFFAAAPVAARDEDDHG